MNTGPTTQTRVIVGLSGGVDSSVTAWLLQRQGYHVEGVFMQNWVDDGKSTFCSTDRDLSDVRAVCDILRIRLHTVCFAQQYWDRVFQHFLAEYAAGRTPNPDILCNKEIKFRAFLDYALALGADYIATGHYARIVKSNDQSYQLWKGSDANKDQSYFLYTLQQTQLARSLFPLGEFTKPHVRQLAHDAGLPNHNKKDSTGICFIGERRFRDFLGEYLLARPGDIETVEGEKIGRHQGLMFYTLGQRQGLGIGGLRGAAASPWYVVGKDLARQALIVAQSHDHPWLFSRVLYCSQLHWVGGVPVAAITCQAKTRYRQADVPCEVTPLPEDICRVEFTTPQWAVTPGQSVVFYQGDVCLGGGVITRSCN